VAARFQSNVFSHRLEHLKQCVSKFDRAEFLLDRCLRLASPHLEREYEIVQQLAEQEPTENAAEPIVDHELAAARLTGYYGAAFDMPLYFDLMPFLPPHSAATLPPNLFSSTRRARDQPG
jgi:hypothetical protein